MTDNERVPVGTADKLAAAVPKRDYDFSQEELSPDTSYTNGYNAGRTACLAYLRSIEAAPLTCTLAEVLAMAEPGDVLTLTFSGLAPSYIVRTCDGWWDASAHEDASTIGEEIASGAQHASTLTKPNGAVYSLREGEAGAEPLPAAEQPADAPSVAHDPNMSDPWRHIAAIWLRLTALEQSGLAEQLRTLQQDVAALRQQGGGMGIPAPGDLRQIYDNARRYSEGLVMEDCDKCEGYGYGYVHIGPGDDDEAEVDCTSCLGTGKLPAAEQPADSRTFMGIPIKVNPAMPSDTAVLTDGRHEVTIKPADAPSVVDDPDMNDPWRHIAAIWLRLAKAELALNNETGDLYQQLRALQQRVDKMQGGVVQHPTPDDEQRLPGLDTGPARKDHRYSIGERVRHEGVNCMVLHHDYVKGQGWFYTLVEDAEKEGRTWYCGVPQRSISKPTVEQQGGELREGVHITAAGIAKLRQRCHDNYNGGHHDEPAHGAFHHGMDTVCNVLESYLPQPPAPEVK